MGKKECLWMTRLMESIRTVDGLVGGGVEERVHGIECDR